MEVPRKGPLWRLLQSWWILLTFSVMFNWVAFFYIAGRTRNKRWALWGLIYAVPFILLMVESFDPDSWQYELIITSLIIGIISSIIHAFAVRKEFLLRLEARQLAFRKEEAMMVQQIGAEYGVKLTSPANKPVQASTHIPDQPMPTGHSSAKQRDERSKVMPKVQREESANAASSEPAVSAVIDVNTAAESDLAGLPGVGLILAKKAVQHRQVNNGFQSVDEFIEVLGLKPHVIQRIRPLITVRPLAPKPKRRRGRVVDY